MALSPKQRKAILVDIRDEARELADMSFLTKDEAIQSLFDTFNWDRSQLVEILNDEWTKKNAAQASWPNTTDVDRLFEAFAKLENHSVVTLHNPHFTPPVTFEAMVIEGGRRASEGKSPIGGIAYCGVGIVSALKNNILPIFTVTDAEGSTSETDFGKLVLKVLRDTGLDAAFDEEGNDILINMTWQKRTIMEPLPKFDFYDEDEFEFSGEIMDESDISGADTDYAEELVWCGFLTKAEVLAELIENSDDDPEEIAKSVEEFWQQKLDAEESWPDVTDVDRLHLAFEAINKQSVLALHNLGDTNTDSMHLAGTEWQRLGGEASGFLGSVHYHWQALQGARHAGELLLGFDSYPGSTTYPTPEARMNAVGMITTRTLQEHGLDASWNGDIDNKISVKLSWQKRAIFEPIPKMEDADSTTTSTTGPDLMFASRTMIESIIGLDEEGNQRKRTVN